MEKYFRKSGRREKKKGGKKEIITAKKSVSDL